MFRFTKFCIILTFISLDTIPANPVSKKADRLPKDLELKHDINVPELIQNLTGLMYPRSRLTNHGMFKIRLGIPGYVKIMNTIGRMIKRRNFAYVELGPGAFKSEIVTYPPKYHENQLKKLLLLKKKMEEKHVDLNEGRDIVRK